MSKLRITTQLIVDEAKRRNWRVEIIDASLSVIRLHPHDTAPILLKSVISNKSSALAMQIADFKNITSFLAKENAIATPDTEEVTSLSQANAFLEKYKKIVVKPLAGAHSHGVTIDIRSEEQLKEALNDARPFSRKTLIQQQVEGKDVRLLFIGEQLAAAAIRRPAYVTGDGQNTIVQLIELENQRPERDENYQAILNVIPAKQVASFLGSRIERIPAKGEEVTVVGPANMGAGGVSIAITDQVDQTLVELGRRMCQVAGLGIGGVDFMIPDPCAPINATNPAYLIEINSAPSFGLHEQPHFGKAQPVSKRFLDWLVE